MNEKKDALEGTNENSTSDIDTKIPWHFWLIVGLAGLYLAFRLIEFVILGIKAIF